MFFSKWLNESTNELPAFLAHTMQNSSDSSYLILADWLEEHGDEDGSALIRTAISSFRNKDQSKVRELTKLLNNTLSRNKYSRIWLYNHSNIEGWEFYSNSDKELIFLKDVSPTSNVWPNKTWMPQTAHIALSGNKDLFYMKVDDEENQKSGRQRDVRIKIYDIKNNLIDEPFVNYTWNLIYGHEDALRIKAFQLPPELIMPIIIYNLRVKLRG